MFSHRGHFLNILFPHESFNRASIVVLGRAGGRIDTEHYVKWPNYFDDFRIMFASLPAILIEH